MAESRSATRGRPHRRRKDFAAIIAGPHYWISVRTKSGRVVRIPVEGKRRKAAGKGKASRATVRPFKGTQGRDVAYRAKGQGGASKAAGRGTADRIARARQLRESRAGRGKMQIDPSLSNRELTNFLKQNPGAKIERVRIEGGLRKKLEANLKVWEKTQPGEMAKVRGILKADKLPPPIIHDYGDGDPGIPDGFHRLTAAMMAGRKSVPAYVVRKGGAGGSGVSKPASGGPTLREQAAARRASKGTREERLSRVVVRTARRRDAEGEAGRFNSPAYTASAIRGDRAASALASVRAERERLAAAQKRRRAEAENPAVKMARIQSRLMQIKSRRGVKAGTAEAERLLKTWRKVGGRG